MRSFRLYEKYLTLTHATLIEDESLHAVYTIKGSFLSLGSRFYLRDLEGQELARIEKKLFSFFSTAYRVCRGAELAAVITEPASMALRRDILSNIHIPFLGKLLESSVADTFNIDLPESGRLEMVGRIPNREYTIEREGKLVATVSRGGLQAGETYLVQIKSGEDYILILACVMVLNLACRRCRKDYD